MGSYEDRGIDEHLKNTKLVRIAGKIDVSMHMAKVVLILQFHRETGVVTLEIFCIIYVLSKSWMVLLLGLKKSR